MHLPAQSHAGASRQPGGTFARLLDIVVIALGAFAALHLEAVADERGYDDALVAFALLAAVFLFPLFGLYRAARRQVFFRCVFMPALAWIVTLAAALLVAIILFGPYRPSGGWFATWALVSGLGLVACRFAERGLGLRRTEQGAHARPVAIVGSGAHCRHLLRKVEATPDSAYVISTIFDTGPETGAAPGAVPAFRDRTGFAEYVRRHRVEELWLALPLSERKRSSSSSNCFATISSTSVSSRTLADSRSSKAK